MFQRFTDSARQAVLLAKKHASTYDHQRIDTAHLLIGSLRSDDTIRAALDQHDITEDLLQLLAETDLERHTLSTLGVDLDTVRSLTEESFGPGALNRDKRQSKRRPFRRRTNGGPTHLPFSSTAKSCLEQSLRESLVRKDSFICGGHIALATMVRPQPIRSYLEANGHDPEQVRVSLAACISTGQL